MLCVPGGITYKPRHSANAQDQFKSGLITKLTRQSLFGFRRTFLIPNLQFGIQAHCCKGAQVMPLPRVSGVLSQSQSHILTAWHHLTKSILLSCLSFPMVIGVSTLQPVSSWKPGWPETSYSLSVSYSYLEGDSGRGFVILVVIPSRN